MNFDITSKKTIYIDKERGNVYDCDNSEIQFSERQEKVNDYIARFYLTYKNSGKKKEIIPVFECVSDFTPDFYMIPCVNYNGNEWGNCKEPKGTEYENEPWIFPSDRTGVPGCSITETKGRCVGIFAGNDELSENASASVYFCGGKTIQRIYFSHIEYPKTYLRKWVFADPIIEYLSFEEGQERTFVCYVYNYEKGNKDGNYGYSKLFDYINLEYVKPFKTKYSVELIKQLDFEFICSVTECKNGEYISNMGFLPNGEHRLGDSDSKFIFRTFGNYQIGWCGQNVTVAEIYLRRYFEDGDEKNLEIGISILDTWLKRQYKNGLISVEMEQPYGAENRIDTCNLGWFVWKAVWCCKLLKKAGKNTEKLENAVKKLCDYFITAYPHEGFPQMLDCNGKIVTEEGCAGTMLLAGFLYAYEYFNDERYLSRANSAFDFYYDTYLKNSIAAGGALDTYCIDKESAGPVLRAAILLYEITDDKKYLEKAEKIAHYLMTWCFYHNVRFPENSDCGRLNIKTVGATAVSTAHHHLDCWGAYYVPDMMKLYKLTGNSAYKAQAEILWNFTPQYISDGTLILHGMTRMPGAQNEAVIQCNWHQQDEEKGQLNDWLIVWVKTFQLDAIYALEEINKRGIKF